MNTILLPVNVSKIAQKKTFLHERSQLSDMCTSLEKSHKVLLFIQNILHQHFLFLIVFNPPGNSSLPPSIDVSSKNKIKGVSHSTSILITAAANYNT